MKYLAAIVAAFLFSLVGTSAYASMIGHWDDNEPGYPRGYAYIHDQTPSQYPVYTAAVDWDQAPKLDLVYRSGDAACSSSHCVPFKAVALGPAGCTSGIAGYTDSWLSGVHITAAISRVDTGCGGNPYSNRLQLVCHEMGHAIGLRDRSATAASCMRAGAPLSNQTDGSATDFSELSTAYGHDG